MSDIIVFLRERITRDEEVARAAEPGPWAVETTESVFGHEIEAWIKPSGEHALDIGRSCGGCNEGTMNAEDATHITRHDPARVLREIAAKWRIVNEATDIIVHGNYCDGGEVVIAEQMLEYLAAVYSDHPNYRKEWCA